MSSLKKYKKHQLIKLVENYEQDIEDLHARLDEMELSKERIVKEYIMVDDENNKTIQYIKKRIQVINDRHKKAIYVKELKRLTNHQISN